MDLILGLLSGLLGIAALLTAWIVFWGEYYGAPTSSDEVRFITTEDGWRIALSRYRAKGEAKKHPVLLCHGLACNRYTFDLPEVSLARDLSEAGYDVWSLELRGHGLSEHPGFFARRGKHYGWSVDDYLRYDVPAAIQAVFEATGAKQLHWIGQSKGGIILYSYLCGPGAEQILSGVTIASSLDYSSSDSEFHRAAKLHRFLAFLPYVPLGFLTKLMAPFCGRFNNGLERFQYWQPNMDPLVAREHWVNTFHSVSFPVLTQLRSAFEPGGFRSLDGKTLFSSQLASVQTPVLAISGSQDRQCPPSAAEVTFNAVGSARKRWLLCGSDSGFESHYGHFDLLIGKRASQEVFPRIREWLDDFERC